jgi:hypothetical protein
MTAVPAKLLLNGWGQFAPNRLNSASGCHSLCRRETTFADDAAAGFDPEFRDWPCESGSVRGPHRMPSILSSLLPSWFSDKPLGGLERRTHRQRVERMSQQQL